MVVGKYDFKENPKSDLDLDLGFFKIGTSIAHMYVNTEKAAYQILLLKSLLN